MTKDEEIAWLVALGLDPDDHWIDDDRNIYTLDGDVLIGGIDFKPSENQQMQSVARNSNEIILKEVFDELKNNLLLHWEVKGKFFSPACRKYKLQISFEQTPFELRFACEANNTNPSTNSITATFVQVYGFYDLKFILSSAGMERRSWLDFNVVRIANSVEQQIRLIAQ